MPDAGGTADDPTRREGAKRYEGAELAVSYEVGLCLHAAECVRGLPAVFDVERRPWITPDGAPAAEVAEVIERCPSGALQYHGPGRAERARVPTRLAPHEDGVLHARGDLVLGTPEGARRETRVMLCACGHTAHSPFCDHSGSRCKAHD
ncbi:(4Fe-4S)-binding protein [Streptomyces sp. NPDC088768]|uniref:(4Fe-4S)-binding protein n=1 Tax=Streptomyces sp. NPDC088768 TaxID=3365894 RepID=UPI0037F8581F